MRKKKEKQIHIPVGERVVGSLELPRDIVLGMPKITVLGDREAFIENYKGIIEYDNTVVKLNTSLGMITLLGELLDIKTITDEDITISGKITKMEFLF